MQTWIKANRGPRRLAVRYEATRPILAQVIAAGFIDEGQVPGPWRRLCHVDRAGNPLPDSPALPVVPAP